MTAKKTRIKLFVARGFQVRFIALILAFMFSIAFLAGYIVYFTAWVMFGEKLARVYPQGDLLDIVNKVNMVLLSRLLLISPIVVLIGLVLSNRIAGPIHRIKKYLNDIARGNYDKRLNLRKKDELKDLAMELNKLVVKLKQDKDKRSEAVQGLVKSTEELSRMLKAKNHFEGEITSILDSLRENINKLD